MAVPPVPAVPVAPFADATNTSNVSWGWRNWFKQIRDRLNIGPLGAVIPGPYSNDGQAAAGGVGLHEAYYTGSGTVVVRMS